MNMIQTARFAGFLAEITWKAGCKRRNGEDEESNKEEPDLSLFMCCGGIQIIQEGIIFCSSFSQRVETGE